MKSNLKFKGQEYTLQRYPKTENNSLQAWSNAELLAMDVIANKTVSKIYLFNDRFGVWNVALHDKNPVTVWAYASQQTAIRQNLQRNNLPTDINFKTPLDDLKKVDLAVLKIPKSLDLFELFLQQIYKASVKNTEVICCFMTKYFSPSYLKIANKYFEDVTQTKAWKKARLLVLKEPKQEVLQQKNIRLVQWKNHTLQQYYGVFSSDKIDIGTQFLLEHLKRKEQEHNVLDLASGNGIIAFDIVRKNPTVKVTLIDDFNLAIASSKINLQNYNADFICAENLEQLPKNNFDLVVSNPPFHFEYENNIEVSLSLFKGVKKCLKLGGRFVLVANKHLNYKTHLIKIFSEVDKVASNKKFVIYSCR